MRAKKTAFLIVDDEPDMCWALERILKKKGLLSEKALNGLEALTLIGKYDIRLIFLDAKLPDIDGLDLAKRIREINPTTRIVMVSGYFYRDDVDVKKALSEGLICGFISKPFLHNEVLKEVELSNSF